MDGARKIAEWCLHEALPFWVANGWDTVHGGFLESVAFDGSAIRGDVRRVRVQARQIYVFARAYHEGWADNLSRAEEAANLLRQRAWQADGQPGWAHLLTDDGRISDPVRDLYDHAFILLALAWLGRATGNADYFDLADETLAFLDTCMAGSGGGYVESLGGAQLPRRQNPHMHLFEALMALYRATGRPEMLSRARAIKGLFDDIYFDADRAVLREFYDQAWGGARGVAGRTVEPGHLCEWSTLLYEFHRVSGESLSPACEVLYLTAMRHGVNPKTGLLYAAIDPRGQVLDASSRTWMQTEWLRIAILLRGRGIEYASEGVERACAGLFNYYLRDVLLGCWIDRFDAAGNREADCVPASTLYHLFGIVGECMMTPTDAVGWATEPK
ncbi:AGE family epimerase/isomerase [Maricaulis sp.]|uniref:AGE family epimerase/isomerase n=1 Tax=Maricaulis sp. TaxID=1486257 RepID=UPI003A9110A2